MCVCVCFVGGRGPDPLLVLECAVACGGDDRSWMKVSCPIVCVGGYCCCFSCVHSVCMCVFFVLQGVCALSTSTPLGKCNRCAFQCSSSSRAGGWRRLGRVLWPACGCCCPECILSIKSALDHQPLAPATFPRKIWRMWWLITTLTWQSTRQITHIPSWKYSFIKLLQAPSGTLITHFTPLYLLTVRFYQCHFLLKHLKNKKKPNDYNWCSASNLVSQLTSLIDQRLNRPKKFWYIQIHLLKFAKQHEVSTQHSSSARSLVRFRKHNNSVRFGKTLWFGVK